MMLSPRHVVSWLSIAFFAVVMVIRETTFLKVVAPTAMVEPSAAVESASNDEYTHALAMLRCLTTPGCFPSKTCASRKKPQRIPRGKEWEEQAFCVDDVAKDDCLVYSFGVHSSPDWEQKMHKYFGCEVHAFDPTFDYPKGDKNKWEGVEFHKLGLQGKGTDMSATHAFEYDPIDPSLLLPLDQIMKQLGHTTLDVLMLDCEGCEWGVLKQLACASEMSRSVKQIVVEFHFQKVLGLYNENDVRNAADAITCLWNDRWGIVAIEEMGGSPADAEYAKGVTQVVHNDLMLLSVAFQRTPEDKPLFSDLLEESGNTKRIKHITQSEFKKKYGKDLPADAQSKLKALEEEKIKAHQVKQNAFPRSVAFDKYERVKDIPVH